jgi:molybdopterin biosynthesis enzyme
VLPHLDALGHILAEAVLADRDLPPTGGARTVFHGVAMKPGKPFLYALAEDGRAIFGLPGNPLSAMTGLFELVLPALRKLAGGPTPPAGPPCQLASPRLGGVLQTWAATVPAGQTGVHNSRGGSQ